MAVSSTVEVIKTPNLFLHLPPHDANARLPTIIFFITGNPGLISYYHEFLSLLCRQQSRSSTEISVTSPSSNSRPTPESCVIAGFSLGGFDLPTSRTTVTSEDATTHETETDGTADDVWTNRELEDLLYPPGFQRKAIYGLQDQIDLCYARLTALVEKVRERYTKGSDQPKHMNKGHSAEQDRVTDEVANVILIGHSVGAYIALEMVRTHHAVQTRPTSTSTPTSTPTSTSTPLSIPSPATSSTSTTTLPSPTPSIFTITTSILLTPTILNISHSPSGRLATPLLSTLPFLPTLAQSSTWALTSLLPVSRLNWLVGKVTGMRAGSDALGATVAFLRCPGAVRQALWLAGQEMQDIGANRWGEEVWGVLKGEGDVNGAALGRDVDVGRERVWKAPKLCFWFAQGDHWVADVTRVEIESIVGRRGGVEGDGPMVIVDEDQGLVHAWCIEQSEMVAVRVRSWIRDALLRTMKV